MPPLILATIRRLCATVNDTEQPVAVRLYALQELRAILADCGEAA